MNNENLYETPKAELSSNEKFEFFGGWLRFYQVTNIISLTVISLVILAAIAYFYFNMYEILENNDLIAAFFEMLPDVVFPILVLRILTKRDETVPAKMVEYLGYYVFASVVIFSILYYFFQQGSISEKPTSFWGSVVYYFIWTSYFKRSERVKVYYGANAAKV